MTFSETVFETYVADIKNAWEKDYAEANLANLFSSFVQDAFEVKARAFIFEQTIHMAEINRRGRTDILFGDLVFEFKKSKSFKTADRTQLRDYLIQMNKSGYRYTGLFTDGLNFEAYTLRDGELHPVDNFNLAELNLKHAFVKLDAYLFSRHSQAPTSQDVVARFGGESPTFTAFEQELSRLYDRVKDTSIIKTWRLQWQRLLSRVYGSDIGDDSLFLRHTYLCQFAKLLSYASLQGLSETVANVEGIIKGDAFRGLGVKNIGETDFFSWVLMKEIRKEAISLFQQLAASLIVYDLSAVDQDLLKQLYQNLVDTQTRHGLGEYYTPGWLVGMTLEDINYQYPQSLYDPTCGSGTFLFSAIRRLAQQGLTGWPLVEFATNNIVGTDVHPLAVTIARMNYLLALAEHMRGNLVKTRLLNIPIFMADSLLRAPEEKNAQDVIVQVDEEGKEAFRIPIQITHNEDQLSEMIDQLEAFARTPDPNRTAFLASLQKIVGEEFDSLTSRVWTQNLTLLAKLKVEDRNGIWAYILKNQVRPLALAKRKFDVIVGNPPWLAYNAIQSESYKRDVKRLYKHYNLIKSSDVKLFTQMDLSTLFYALVRDRYMKSNGTLAFVMPRSVLTGAK